VLIGCVHEPLAIRREAGSVIVALLDWGDFFGAAAVVGQALGLPSLRKPRGGELRAL